METSEWSNFFFQWAATLFWIFFLTGMTGSIIANLWRFARKRHFINDTIFMRMLLWPVLISFFVPVIFLYWQQKEGRHAFQYEMFRSAGFVTLMLSAVIIIWLAGALRRTAITVCQLNSLYQLKINAKRDLLWQEDEQKETYKLCAKMGICRHVTVFISKEIVSPMTMGFLNPCIFLPAGEIDKETLRLILVHELTHIHHKDFLMKQMMLVISSLYWFCPGIKQLFAELNVCNEYYCDLDSIKQLGIDQHEYFSKIRAFAADQKQRRCICIFSAVRK